MTDKTKITIRYERSPGRTMDNDQAVCTTSDWLARPADVVQQAAGLCGYGKMIERSTNLNNAKRYDCGDIRVLVTGEPY